MNANASLLVWRPPYPSENLKTPRFVLVQTCSTTNPYATQEEQSQHASQQASQHASQQATHQASQQASAYLQDLQHSKRENSSDKIYERGLTPQVGMNPFLQGNYLQDLETQNQFLKPLNSNIN
jgi:DNA topoisomerase VI subunit B